MRTITPTPNTQHPFALRSTLYALRSVACALWPTPYTRCPKQPCAQATTICGGGRYGGIVAPDRMLKGWLRASPPPLSRTGAWLDLGSRPPPLCGPWGPAAPTLNLGHSESQLGVKDGPGRASDVLASRLKLLRFSRALRLQSPTAGSAVCCLCWRRGANYRGRSRPVHGRLGKLRIPQGATPGAQPQGTGSA